jgi:hypothetical protein
MMNFMHLKPINGEDIGGKFSMADDYHFDTADLGEFGSIFETV